MPLLTIASGLLGLLAIAILAACCHFRLRRARERERLSREVEDTLVQNAQGLILNVHGIVKDLPSDDPRRRRVEAVLDLADEQLSSDREQVQQLRQQTTRDGVPPEDTPK